MESTRMSGLTLVIQTLEDYFLALKEGRREFRGRESSGRSVQWKASEEVDGWNDAVGECHHSACFVGENVTRGSLQLVFMPSLPPSSSGIRSSCSILSGMETLVV
jgi:hypothetical protein